MEASRKLLAAALLVVLLLAATGTGPVMVAEARTCQSQSHRFRGPCVRRSNCANVCRTEGFPDGKCRGFRRRCFCTTHCHHH
ncbi:defensin Ec-AMP-D2-like isoform X1 [Lolium rigidum]|uniref:defensin Ec-AMP-D2-like isoform X1 n=1 Tax=Lolium rigidum TaxID=89674 RepID=UPI001F5C209B|nr:defensin Ec-AMP-D2-like isoform X1 [Lolium rigidum]